MSRRLYLDLVIIFGAAALLRLWLLRSDVAPTFSGLAGERRLLGFNELVLTLCFISAAFLVFAIRCIRRQRAELTLRVAAELHARQMACHDSLTGLANRRHFEDVLNAKFAAGELEGPAALYTLDLTGFRSINEVFGHAVGDEILRIMARRLNRFSDEATLIARLGSKEFSLLCPGLGNRHQAEDLAKRIIGRLEDPVLIGSTRHEVGTALGIVMLPSTNAAVGTAKSDVAAQEALRRSEIALHEARLEMKSGICFYDDEMDAALQERAALQEYLQEAIGTDGIVPHFQAVVELSTGSIVKFESLARWQHPTLGEIPAARFIALAEDCGLIGPLTEDLLRRACEEARHWPSHVKLSVNLSPVLLRDRTIGLRFLRILGESGLAPNRLELEVTERVFVRNIDSARGILDDFRAAGIHISLDDFGTGYATLSQLQNFPFDGLKIDRSFVQTMSGSNDSAAIVGAILSLGRGLGLTVTAEGIEAVDQQQALLLDGCALGQGYLFSRAVNASEARALVLAQTAEKATAQVV
ncbi:putative bifunctional diguanylate cyclase/phosphodiesterase [Faunimonas pinastri]|nr:EAL domain-containing protein [Faunimonas pinastri]